MNRIYLPATSPADWQRLLAEPEKHWKTGYSARTLAHCWHAVASFPPEVGTVFAALLSATGAMGTLDAAGDRQGIRLFLGWVCGDICLKCGAPVPAGGACLGHFHALSKPSHRCSL